MEIGNLKAIVIGAGWAGEGHTRALQHCGVEVVAICARKEKVVQEVAARLDVPQASTNWRRTLDKVKPDIVSLATPATLRTEVVEEATRMGCHLLCDKPLATTAEEARRIYDLVAQAEVKHAYASTQQYDPSVAWVRELLAAENVGQLRAIDVIICVPAPPQLKPWSWMDSLALGGGGLNNALPHFLGILERMTNSKLVAVAGEAHIGRRQAPFVPDIHDFREMMGKTVTPEEAAQFQWRNCDADVAFSALLQFEYATSKEQGILPVLIHADGLMSSPPPINGWYFYGDEGMLVGENIFSITVTRQAGSEREILPTPQRLMDEVPQLGDNVLNKWAALAEDFVADVVGEAHNPYPTFREGLRYQYAIDAIREGKGWYQIPEPGK